jgi:hypothetical protein
VIGNVFDEVIIEKKYDLEVRARFEQVTGAAARAAVSAINYN